jgi:hypothetical protein
MANAVAMKTASRDTQAAVYLKKSNGLYYTRGWFFSFFNFKPFANPENGCFPWA